MFIQHLFRDSLSIRLLVTSPRHDGSSSICSVNVQFHSPRNYCVCAKFPVVLMVRHLMHAIECARNEPNRMEQLCCCCCCLFFPALHFYHFLHIFFFSFHFVSGVLVCLCHAVSSSICLLSLYFQFFLVSLSQYK